MYSYIRKNKKDVKQNVSSIKPDEKKMTANNKKSLLSLSTEAAVAK